MKEVRFEKEIKKLMIDTGINAKALARKMNVSERTLSRYLADTSNMKLVDLVRMCAYLERDLKITLE